MNLGDHLQPKSFLGPIYYVNNFDQNSMRKSNIPLGLIYYQLDVVIDTLLAEVEQNYDENFM